MSGGCKQVPASVSGCQWVSVGAGHFLPGLPGDRLPGDVVHHGLVTVRSEHGDARPRPAQVGQQPERRDTQHSQTRLTDVIHNIHEQG